MPAAPPAIIANTIEGAYGRSSAAIYLGLAFFCMTRFFTLGVAWAGAPPGADEMALAGTALKRLSRWAS